MPTQKFVLNVEEIRRKAREHINAGAVTPDYLPDREQVVSILNEALATELVCVLRYKQHYFLADGIHAKPVAEEFAEHAAEEQDHADQIAARIKQLDGKPDFNPEGLTNRSHSQFDASETLIDMIKEDLIAERVAIETYREIARFLSIKDPTSRRMIEEILAKEEEHAEELQTLLLSLDPTKRPAEAA